MDENSILPRSTIRRKPSINKEGEVERRRRRRRRRRRYRRRRIQKEIQKEKEGYRRIQDTEGYRIKKIQKEKEGADIEGEEMPRSGTRRYSQCYHLGSRQV